MVDDIRKVCIVGSGVMGSGIAAHLANVGIDVLLLDIVPKDVPSELKGLSPRDRKVRNYIVETNFKRMLEAKPPHLYDKRDARRIELGNLEDDIEKMREADWIIEVVVENLDIKRKVFETISRYRKKKSIVSSNTSGIPLRLLKEGLDEEMRAHMLITHFFNPPRYLRLVELVRTNDTDEDVFKFMYHFIRDRVGKGVVEAKDTPNFIANRIGVYGMMKVLSLLPESSLTIKDIDNIFGKPMGRPKSAVFRTADLVGIDTLYHVANNIYEGCPDDPERDLFRPPEFLKTMIDQKLLGAKAGGGFYKRIKKNGQKKILALDVKKMEYFEPEKRKFPSLSAAKSIDDPSERLKTLLAGEDDAARMAWEVFSSTILYTLKIKDEIANNIVDIDRAMRWGFGWDMGPFESLDAIGLDFFTKRLSETSKPVPDDLKDIEDLYRYENMKKLYFDFTQRDYKPVELDPSSFYFDILKSSKEKLVEKNLSASIYDIDDGIFLLEFHSKMNAIDDDIIKMIHRACDIAEKDGRGLVVANDGEHFSAGANLMLILMLSQSGDWDAVNEAVRQFQSATMRLKYSSIPVVSAPHNMALGGGCEVILGSNRVVASPELYMGLVEVGAGLIPAGGGCKEMVIRMQESVQGGFFPPIRKAFELIGFAKVSMSAKNAKKLGYLKSDDIFVFNPDHRIKKAKEIAIKMSENYKSQTPLEEIYLPGKEVELVLVDSLKSMRLRGLISEHDELIGSKLAHILCGGDEAKRWKPVTEQYLLDLEREAFVSLCGEKKSQERMQALLMTGKPLRN